MRFDRFSYFFDFALCPPLAALFLWLGGRAGGGAAVLAGWGLIGLMAWTLIEYWVHRTLFHHAPMLRRMHGAHHDEPNAFIGAAPGLLPLILLGFACLFLPLLGAAACAGLSAGFQTGYLFYSCVHYATHHVIGDRGAYLKSAKRRHMLHHFAAADANFGVTTGFWDHVFATARDPRFPRAGSRGLRTSG